ncbi:MAG: hypothetical protein IBX57_00280 [Gammaproteobacteria bacterium]|nr:hypothetical protein [Gammaproteobacteria bacterium]
MSLLQKYNVVGEPTVESFLENLDQVVHKLETSSKHMTILDAEIARIEGLEAKGVTVSVEDASSELLEVVRCLSNEIDLESLGIEDEVGGHSDLLKRLLDGVIQDKIRTINLFLDVFKSWPSMAKKYKEKLTGQKNKLKNINKDVNFKSHITTESIARIFLKAKGKKWEMSDSIVQDISDLNNLADFFINDYHPRVSSILLDAVGLLDKISKDNTDANEILKKFLSSTPSLDKIIPKKYLTTFISGTELKIEDKSESILGKLGLQKGKEVKFTSASEGFFKDAFKLYKLEYPDVRMSYKELSDLIDESEKTLTIIEETMGVSKGFEEINKRIDVALNKHLKGLEGVSDIDADTLKGLGEILKDLSTNAIKPMISISKTIILTNSQTYMLTDSLLKNPE